MLPHVIVHNEMSLDARMDGLDVDMGRFYGLAGTWHEDCTLVGSETLLAGMPELGGCGERSRGSDSGDTTGQGGGASADAPLLAAVDSRGRLPGLSQLRDQPYWRDVIALCSEATPADHLGSSGRRRRLEHRGGDASVSTFVARSRRSPSSTVSPSSASTPAVPSSARCCGTGLVHEVSVVIEPRLVGGETHRWLVRAPDATPGRSSP